ncbi:hypothetical protein Tsubulata_040606 [Turnera subulata]|uniref:F-box domain-containing protein n=1 Tax=Turnera subulata TaxID=218843 RepID=A0A9Q0FJI5_9ROSI|nr:hypothetical protein Tsubulata_040606 [Turnera subulata]
MISQERNGRSDISKLPIECIEHIMSFTSPGDVCSLSMVCRAIRDVAESNALWDRFMPSEGSEIISLSIAFKPLIFESAKQKYFYLCHKAVFLDDGFMCFTLDKQTGKRCFMIAPTVWSILGDGWEWNFVQGARFSLVPELKYGPALGFVGRMECKLLSPQTTYAAYLVFKLADCSYGFEAIPVELSIYFDDRELDGVKRRRVLLDPPEDMLMGPQERPDGWKEISMGQFFIGHQYNGAIHCCLKKAKSIYETRFCGIIINGIEIRPSRGLR